METGSDADWTTNAGNNCVQTGEDMIRWVIECVLFYRKILLF